MKMEWDADCVDDYGGIPEPGDFIDNGVHGELLVTRTSVCNNSKVEMKVKPASDGICFYDDPCDPSQSWEEIDEKYLDNNGSTNFLNNGLTPNE